MDVRIGVDIGGTFTDLAFLHVDGTLQTMKVLSTPEDYSKGIARGLEQYSIREDLCVSSISEIVHGTTVATNTILEHKGAKVALITTEGFRDVLEIRRMRMPVLYDLRWQKPAPLVPRHLRYEVNERISAEGEVLFPPDLSAATETIRSALASGAEAIAICLLNAYVNGAHERELRALVNEIEPRIPVCISSEVLPEIKEYERTSTTVVNTYITPVVESYLRSLVCTLDAMEVNAPLKVMQSSGGVMGVEAACKRPIHIIESGPAAGIVGAAAISNKLGFQDVLTFDMGGTTAKAAIIENGEYDRVGELDVGAGINHAARLLNGGGYHVSVPAIDIVEVGAGGGSLIRIDSGGSVRIGPESAGAVPGPVCYGSGGKSPTITDANVVLGYLNPRSLVGGDLLIDFDAAHEAIRRDIAEPLDVSVETAAMGAHKIANAAMERALRSVSSERGRDPREFPLIVFGGNGPLHGISLAASIGIRKVLVPPASGVLSAFGLLCPDSEHHYVRTHKTCLADFELEFARSKYGELEAEGEQTLRLEGYPIDDISHQRMVDLHYIGEASIISVSLDDMAQQGQTLNKALREKFEAQHEALFGYQSEDDVVEIVNLRVKSQGVSATPREPGHLHVRSHTPNVTSSASRKAYFGPEYGWIETNIVGRFEIGKERLKGPLIIEEYESTCVVPPNGSVQRGKWDVLTVDLDNADSEGFS